MIERTIAARRELDLWCEVTYLRALLSVAARDGAAADKQALRERLTEIGRAIDERAAGGDDRDGPMATLADRLALEPVQVELIWAIVAVSADPRLAIPLEGLWGAPGRRGLGLAAYAHLRGLDAAVGRELALWLVERNPLVEGDLLAAVDPTAPPAGRSYVASNRLLAHLVCDDQPGAGLQRIVGGESLIHDAAQEAVVAELARLLAGERAVILVEGPRGSGRTSAIAKASARPVVVLEAGRRERVSAGGLAALRREVTLGTVLPVIADGDQLPKELGLGALLDSFDGPVVVTSAMAGMELGTDRSVVRVRWPLPDVTVRARMWQRAGGDPTGDVENLAMRYRIGAGVIARAVASARAQHGGRLDTADLAAGLKHNIAEDLGGLATPVVVNQSWADLVLSDDTRDHVQTLIARIRHGHQVLVDWQYRSKMARGTGVPALFSGPPGTGKTMVAGLIARELELELYQVDLSQIVSKWVGETEKQLARVFDAAEQGHVLLLFDEADSLFGQRSQDVKSAVDRYANLEVNYLLQRVESFGGITILTTNLESGIDSALKRRLAAHIVFELPDEDERAVLWKRLITTGASPLAADLDIEHLSRTFPKMSGANIRNAALAAAFLAAAERASMINQDHMMRAARSEYRSMGHVLSERGRG